MSPLRLASYNVEWFNALFDDAGQLLNDAEPSARFQTSRATQLAALGRVFTALNADGVMIIEAPNTGNHRSTVTALENFAHHFRLRARKAIIGYASDTEQEIAFLYDPDSLSARHDPQGGAAPPEGALGAPRFDGARRSDLDGDGVEDVIRFSKPPLELAVITAQGQHLRLVGVHAKSKAPRGHLSAAEFTRIAIDNRRRQLAECLWLRAQAEVHLTAGENLIVLGDFNDGPGLDEYEKLFGHSGVEIVLGVGAPPPMRLTDPHAAMALSRHAGPLPTSARFWLAPQKRYFEALIDFIMLSPGLVPKATWRIWHPLNDPGVQKVAALDDALLSASDHFPVTVDLAD